MLFVTMTTGSAATCIVSGMDRSFVQHRNNQDEREVFSMEFILTQSVCCVKLLMGLLTVMLNLRLISQLKRKKGAQQVGIVISLLCSNIFAGLVTATLVLMYYVGALEHGRQRLCESEVPVFLGVLSTMGVMAKMCSLGSMNRCMRSSRSQNQTVIALICLIALCSFSAFLKHNSAFACGFLWVSVSNTHIIKALLPVALYVMLVTVLIKNFKQEKQQDYRVITLESGNHSQHHDMTESDASLTSTIPRKQRVLRISFLVCWLPACLYQMSFIAVATWFPERPPDISHYWTGIEEAIYTIYLLNCILDPILYNLI